MNYYPKWVYSYREDITRENKRQYDERYEHFYKEWKQQEKELNRPLTYDERNVLRDKWNV